MQLTNLEGLREAIKIYGQGLSKSEIARKAGISTNYFFEYVKRQKTR